MKKKFSAIAAVLALLTAITLSGCMFFTQPDDRFPYDAAVTRGEEGSEADWLASLTTPSSPYRRAYEEAKADGFTGDFAAFLQSIGASSNEAAIHSSLRSVVTIEANFSTYYQAGSGIIYSLDTAEGDAYIVTNYHVLYTTSSLSPRSGFSDDIRVFLYGGEVGPGAMKATYVGGVMDYDIAVLRVEDEARLTNTKSYTTVAAEAVFGNSDSVSLGEPVFAIGNAMGYGISVTEGIISKELQYIRVSSSDEKDTLTVPEIRTDAALNEGNSGGGLFNAAGELIGMTNAGEGDTTTDGLGYAIPSNLVAAVAQNIIDTCTNDKTARGAACANLGITIGVADSRGVYDPETGKVYVEEKIIVRSVEPGSIADALRLDVADTVIRATLHSTRNGEPYTHTVEFTRTIKLEYLLYEIRKGDKLELTISRAILPIPMSCTIEFDGNEDFISQS